MVIKTVKRGYILRFNHEEFWNEELYLIPKGSELFDSDAIPYYVDYNDVQPLKEYYGRYAPYDCDKYQTGEPYEESVKYLNKAMLEEKARI